MLDPNSWYPRSRTHSAGSRLLREAQELWAKKARDPAACNKALDRLYLSLQYSLDSPESLRRAELLGQIYMWFFDQREALRWLDEALYIAHRLGGDLAIRRLQLHRAINFHFLLQCRAGCATLEPLLLALQHDDQVRVVMDDTFEIDCRLRLAILQFFLADFRRVSWHLDRTQALLDQHPNHSVAQGTLANLRANMYLWDEKPIHALTWGMRAIEILKRTEQPDSEGRTEVLMAQALIALAERHPAGTGRDMHLTEARHHLDLARQIARLRNDQGFMYLVLLARAAYEAALGQWAAAIKHTMRVLDHTTDPVLLAQAWTNLGDIQQKRGETESSTTSYRSALIVLDHSEIPVFGERARRMLMQSSESALD